MGTTNMVSMSVDPGMVEAILRANIETAMVSAMGDAGEKGRILDAIVLDALGQKVDESGKVSSYNSENKHTFISVAVKRMIRKLTQEAVGEYVEAHRETLKVKIAAAIEEKAGTISDSLVDSFAAAALGDLRYKFAVNISSESAN